MDTNSRGEKPTVVIVIPALNEVSTIGMVLDEIPVADLANAGYRVRTVVVDNGSTDGTSTVALQRNAEVILEKRKMTYAKSKILKIQHSIDSAALERHWEEPAACLGPSTAS